MADQLQPVAAPQAASNNEQKAKVDTPTVQLDLLQVQFDLDLQPWQIPQFRGAIIDLAGKEQDLFHNHKTEGGYHYRYPLIQYQSHRGKAAILGLGAGAESLYELLLSGKRDLVMQGKTYPLRIQQMQQKEWLLRVKREEQIQQFALRYWLPLNDERYEKWQQLRSLAKRTLLLEDTLKGEILQFASSVGWRIPERFILEIDLIYKVRKMPYCQTNMMGFDVSFYTNLALPYGLGIGKGSSRGFGRLMSVR